MVQSVNHFSLQAQRHEFKTQNLHERNWLCQRASQCWGDRDREIQISQTRQLSLSGELQASDRDCNNIPREIVSKIPKIDLWPPLMYTYMNTEEGENQIPHFCPLPPAAPVTVPSRGAPPCMA